uniref:Long-chain-fatty-acid--CoA ligase n=2 Tax=Neobacillus citreus TaxID=2833578 RepID=A0A942STX8_9BACI
MIDFIRSRQLLVDQMLERSTRRFPNKIALVSNEVRITYEELHNRVNILAGWLQFKGIKKGDKVALLLFNRIEYAECLYALAKIGAVAVPINFRLQPAEIEYILTNSEAKMIVVDNKLVSTIEAIKNHLPNLEEMVVVDDNSLHNDSHYPYNQIFANPYTPSLVELEDDDDFLICYTSGTTGKPKGAVLSHKNVYMNAMNYSLEFGLTKDEVQLITTPMFHIGGISAFSMVVLMGGRSIFHDKFDPERVLETFDAEKITYSFMVPSMWNMLLEHPRSGEFDVSSLRVLCTAAASTPLELKKRLMKHFPNAGVFDTYGQTETSPGTTTLKPTDSLNKSGSVGLSFTNVEIRVVDERMLDVEPGQVGEIIFRGPTVMKGYYKNPEATAEAFRGGWLHSGDLAVTDEEGYISVVDRKKDMIISGGENIYPKEIEEVLYTHPDILEAAVIGVPDPKWGETVKALIVLRNGKSLTEQEVINYCSGALASYKKPRYVEFLEELPRNAAGKILKTVLRELESTRKES